VRKSLWTAMMTVVVSIAWTFMGLTQDKIEVKVMIFAMFEIGDYRGDFPGEFQHWVEGLDFVQWFEVAGAYGPVLCNNNGVCGTVIGVGKSEAATSITAVLLDPRFDFSKAYFITSGCAGTPPSVGTLGAVFWADWVVDYDLGHRMWPDEGTPFQPLECNPATNPKCVLCGTCPEGESCIEYEPRAYKLNEDLVAWAYCLSKDVELADSEAAQSYRALYTEEAARRTPFVGIGTTVCGDCYFHGPGLSKEAQYICDLYGAGTYSTTEMEDYATATVLARFGYLNRYLSLRDVVNYDQPHPGQTTQESLESSSGAFQIGMENAWRAGSIVVNYIVANWGVWEKGVPEPPIALEKIERWWLSSK